MKYELARTRDEALADLLTRYARVAVSGAPNTGKSKLVDRVANDGRAIVHTDTWKREPWEAQPELIIAACATLDRFLVEGVQVPRALRKGLRVDALLWLVKPLAEQSDRQKSMGKGIATVFESIRETIGIPVVVVP